MHACMSPCCCASCARLLQVAAGWVVGYLLFFIIIAIEKDSDVDGDLAYALFPRARKLSFLITSDF